MKYRVGRKLNRVILDDTGHKVAECLEGNEDVAQQICDLLNEHGLVDNLSQHLVISTGVDVHGDPIKGLTKGVAYQLLREDTDEIIVINDFSQRKSYQKCSFEDC